jgi:hypothetical protein
LKRDDEKEDNPMKGNGSMSKQPEPKASEPRGWALPAILTVLLIAVVGVLTLPMLSAPPQDALPGGIFNGDGTSTDLDPSRSHLAETRDGMIAVYIPEQAYPFGGRLIVQPRRAELIPDRVSDEIERLLAVDLLVIDASGAVVSNVEFDVAPLLCFRPDQYQEVRTAEGQAEILVQRYDDNQIPGDWVDLSSVMGWEDGLVCASLDHLSLFALAASPTALDQAPYGGQDPPSDSQPGAPKLYAPASVP